MTLTVIDGHGATASDSATITVTPQPQAWEILPDSVIVAVYDVNQDFTTSSWADARGTGPTLNAWSTPPTIGSDGSAVFQNCGTCAMASSDPVFAQHFGRTNPRFSIVSVVAFDGTAYDELAVDLRNLDMNPSVYGGRLAVSNRFSTQTRVELQYRDPNGTSTRRIAGIFPKGPVSMRMVTAGLTNEGGGGSHLIAFNNGSWGAGTVYITRSPIGGLVVGKGSIRIRTVMILTRLPTDAERLALYLSARFHHGIQ